MPRIPFRPPSHSPTPAGHKPQPMALQSEPPQSEIPNPEPESGLPPQGGARGVVGFVGAAGKKLAQTGQQVSEAISTGFHALRGDVRCWDNPDIPVPEDKGGLKLASYNIFMGRKDFAAVTRELKAMNADVICLQEASWETAMQLAHDLGLHLVFHQAESGLTRTVGKAILSRYPISETENKTYDDAWTSRLKTAVGEKKFEALENRSLLRASLKIGQRTVEIVDTHLSLSNPEANATQLQQLSDYVVARRATGASVLIAGDFNTNFALTGGAQDAPGQFQTPTDTLAEYVDRYQRHPGNIADASDAAAARRLTSLLQSHWQAPERSVLSSEGSITPEDALKELPQVKRGSPRHKQLLYILDGVSHGGAAKRFDNLLASRDLKLVSSRIDQTATGSDHWPVLMEVAWKES
ncbi:MAG: endonuclease/exonuclease/phosphatase family protein [Candidatus Sericytochromatia bacterium]